MTFIAARPNTFERMHIMTLSQYALRFRGVFKDEIDQLAERYDVVVLLDESFYVALVSRGI